MSLCIEKIGLGRTILQEATTKIKCKHVEDYSLNLYAFSDVTIVTKIISRLLCCHEPCSHGKLPQERILHLYEMRNNIYL